MTDETRYRFESEDDSLDLEGELVFGRSDECDVKLTAGHPSRRHARVRVRVDGVLVEDLGSSNGTFVDGERLEGPRLLTGGEKVNFDLTEYRLVAVRPAAGRGDTADATVVRPLPSFEPAAEPPPEEPPAAEPTAAEPTAAEPPAAEPPAAEPAVAQTVVAQDRSHEAPGSWADPERQDLEGTKLIDPSALAAADAAPLGPGAQVDGPYLRVSNGLAAGRVFKLRADPSGEWQIGSDEGRDIVLADEGISGLHAKLTSAGGRWKLTDQMSANGTFVDDKKANVAYLANGNRVRFGAIECVCHLPGAAARGSARPGKSRKPLVIGVVSFVVTVLIIAIATLG